MRKYGDVNDVREELKGRTDLLPDYEEKLVENIAEIEREADTIPKLDKTNWIIIGIMNGICVLLLILAFTW